MLSRLHKDQGGAVAMMILVATLITLSMSLVIFDSGTAARQKLEVQTAADTAAWSQSAIEARAMNMMSFANVGKRIVIGMGVYYQAIWAAWVEIAAITIGVIAGLAIACVLTIKGGCTTKDAIKDTVKVLGEIGALMGSEGMDELFFIWDIRDKIKKDVEAFDKYQAYQAELTPWWSWAEGTIRGSRNGATSVGLFPVPKREVPEIPVIELGSTLEDSLPVRKANDAIEMCTRSVAPDLLVHMADYIVKNQMCQECVKDKVAQQGTRRALHVMAAGIAAFNYGFICLAATGIPFIIGDAAKPWEMGSYSTQSEWLLASSNLAFTYRAGADLQGAGRQKYGFLSKEYGHKFDLGDLRTELYALDGYFGVSRSEISFQGGQPDLWHASWSARMRPVALPAEWDGYDDMRLVTAYNDAVPYLAVGAEANDLLTSANESTDLADFVRGFLSFEAYTNENLAGLTR